MTYQTNVPHEFRVQFHTPTVRVYSKTGSRWTIPTFKKADGRTYLRFSATTPGRYWFTDGKTKKSWVTKRFSGTNRLYRSGAPRLDPTKKRLIYADGTPFFWLADTWWYGATVRSPWRSFGKIVGDRVSKGFTVTHIVVGIPPEIPIQSPQAANEGGHPLLSPSLWNPAYFDALDRRIAYLVQSGIMPCLVGSWGPHVDVLGVPMMKSLWRELIARYAAYPVAFCLCGEVDAFVHNRLVLSLAKIVGNLHPKLLGPLTQMGYLVGRVLQKRDHTHALAIRLAGYNEVGTMVKAEDPWHRLRLIHPQSQATAATIMGNPSWLDLNTIQSGHSKGREPFLREAIRTAKKRPIFNMEPWYEGILGNFGAYDQRYAFWVSIVSGAVGHTYGAHGVWQMATGDAFMEHWGVTHWKRAISQAGSVHLGRAANYLQTLGCPVFTPSAKLVPAWSVDHSEYPVSGDAGNYCLAYIPDTSIAPFALVLDRHASYRIELRDPKTMGVLRKMRVTGRSSFPLSVPKKEKDCLVIVTKIL